MTSEREILTSILKLTREGPVNIELIAKDSKTPLSVVKEYIAESTSSGLVYLRGKLVDAKPIQRLKIALEAIKLGADLERVCRNLSWSEFEEIAIKAFQVNGYLTIKHFRFRHKNRNWEIDILATKGRIIVCVDCKRWNRRLTSSTALKVVNAQIERVRSLAEALPKIKGKIKGSYSLVCSRCLEIFEKDFSQDVSVTFKPFYETQREGEEIELTLKEMNVNFYKGDRISLLDLIKEEIYILVPLKPLCREDCKGLCPICGKNRNKEECDCQKEEFSSKFAILKTLLKEGRK